MTPPYQVLDGLPLLWRQSNPVERIEGASEDIGR